MKTTVLDHKNIGDYFASHIEKELLKYTAGKYMFCPKCNAVLDWSTVIILDVYDMKKSVHKGKQVVCTKCTKDLATVNFQAIEKKNNVSIEVCSAKFSR